MVPRRRGIYGSPQVECERGRVPGARRNGLVCGMMHARSSGADSGTGQPLPLPDTVILGQDPVRVRTNDGIAFQASVWVGAALQASPS